MGGNYTEITDRGNTTEGGHMWSGDTLGGDLHDKGTTWNVNYTEMEEGTYTERGYTFSADMHGKNDYTNREEGIVIERGHMESKPYGNNNFASGTWSEVGKPKKRGSMQRLNSPNKNWKMSYSEYLYPIRQATMPHFSGVGLAKRKLRIMAHKLYYHNNVS